MLYVSHSEIKLKDYLKSLKYLLVQKLCLDPTLMFQKDLSTELSGSYKKSSGLTLDMPKCIQQIYHP